MAVKMIYKNLFLDRSSINEISAGVFTKTDKGFAKKYEF